MQEVSDHSSPRVSVVIPCYNYAHFLSDAVGSVLRQVYRDFEIIIVNDGSTDETRVTADRIIKDNPDTRIILINQTNQGLSMSRNNGIAAAKGEFILPLDADDIIMPTLLEEAVKALNDEPEAAFAYPDIIIFGDITDDEVRYAVDYDLSRLLRVNFIPGAGSLFRKSVWAEVGGYKKEMNKGYEDWEFWIALGEAGHYGRFLNKRLYNYRKHGPSMLDDSSKKHKDLVYQIRKYHLRLYYPRLSRISIRLARVANFFKWKMRDPVSHFIYRNVRPLHTAIRFTRNTIFGLIGKKMPKGENV